MKRVYYWLNVAFNAVELPGTLRDFRFLFAPASPLVIQAIGFRLTNGELIGDK